MSSANLACATKTPTNIPMPIYEFRAGTWQVGELVIPVLDVHELLAYIHQELMIQCPPEDVQRFWRHLKDNGAIPESHPASDSHIPFSLYGDECVVGGDPRDKVTAMFLQVTLFRPKATRLGNFMLFSVKDEFLVHSGLKSLAPILDHIVWSCNVAFQGFYPQTDAQGQPLPPQKQRMAGKPLTAPDNNRFCCVELKGDWKWHERTLRLHATPTSKEFCFLCDARADDSNLSYANIADDAPWINTEVTTPGFMVKKLRPGLLSAPECILVFVGFLECNGPAYMYTLRNLRPIGMPTRLWRIHGQIVLHACEQPWTAVYSQWRSHASWAALTVEF